jgi:p-methyltransferase
MTPDCIVAGFDAPLFERHEARLRSDGEASEAYRELRFSFVDVDGRKLTYVDLLNEAQRRGGGEPARHFTPWPASNPAAATLVDCVRQHGLAADVDIDWTAFADRDLGATIPVRAVRSSLDTIRRELDSIRRVAGVRNVVFVDDATGMPPARFKDLCRMMLHERYPFTWFSRVGGDHADEEAIDLMARSGCAGVHLDAGSGSPAVLEQMNRTVTVEQQADVIRRLEARGILTFASFVLGFPGETAETVHETADFIEATRPDYYRVQPWYRTRDTPIAPRRAELPIEGDGFVWQHATMDSLSAADHLERLFLTVRGSQWLPRWSFDFWIVPYLFGEGLDAGSFSRFMTLANRLLALDIASVGRHEKRKSQAALMRQLGAWAARLRSTEDACEAQVAI